MTLRDTPSLKPTHISRWLLRYAAKQRIAVLWVLIAMVLRVGVDVIKPWPMKILVDQVFSGRSAQGALSRVLGWLPGGSNPDHLLVWCVLGTVTAFLLGWLIGTWATFANISLGQRMTFALAADLFRHLQRFSLGFHHGWSSGDLVRRVRTDAGCVSTIVRDALLPVVTSAFTLVVMFFIMWRMSGVLTLLSLAVVPLMVLTFKRWAGPMNDLSYAQQKADGTLYDVIAETLSNIAIVQAFAREDVGNRRFADGTGVALSAALATTRVQLLFRLVIGLATALGTAAILGVGSIQVINGTLSVGSLLVFLAYLGSLYAPIEAIMYTGSTLQSAAGSARRVLEVLEHQPDVRDEPGAIELGRASGHVRIDGVTFGYEHRRPVLADVTLEAKPGEFVAIVGHTGAGKSTVMGLIPRLFDPWRGHVTIDGLDLRGLTVASVRRNVGVVQQQPFLFPLTIAENIAYGRPDASQSEIEAAARAANAHRFIERLPDGYRTIIGERGATLSGGERQRVAIARAILKDAPILILDEPTSALDAETEASVMSAIEAVARGRTVFAIAHRLSTVRRADRIVVIDHGRVVEQGTHDELLARGGVYASFHAMQFGSPAAGNHDEVGGAA